MCRKIVEFDRYRNGDMCTIINKLIAFQKSSEFKPDNGAMDDDEQTAVISRSSIGQEIVKSTRSLLRVP